MAPLPFDKLNESNYDDWKIQVEAYLEDQNLFCVIDGREEEPQTGPNSKAVRAYNQKRRQARAKIILAVEPSQLPHTRDQDPAVIWDNLSKIHCARGLGTLLTMRRKFFGMSIPLALVSHLGLLLFVMLHIALRNATALNMLTKSSLHSSASNATPPPDETSPTANATSPGPITPIFGVSDLDKIMVVTAGLAPSYEALIVSLSGTPIATITFEDVITRLLNEEGRQKSLSRPRFAPPVVAPKPNIATAAHHASEKPGLRTGGGPRNTKITGVRCHKCGGIGHLRHQCPSHSADFSTNSEGQANVAEMDEFPTEDTTIAVAHSAYDLSSLCGTW
jgi:hypothetical protein